MDSRTYILRANIAIILCIIVLPSTFFTTSDGRALEGGHRIHSRSSSSVKSLNRVSSSSYGSPFTSLAPQPSISTPSLPSYSPKHPPPKTNVPNPNPNPPPQVVYLPPIVYPPPPASSTSPPPSPHHKKEPEYGVWCVAKPTVPEQIIQVAMDYACGLGSADCKAIQPNGSCYFPNTMLAHASFAFNSYWQNSKIAGGTCDFGGTAMLVTVDPSYGKCNFVLT